MTEENLGEVWRHGTYIYPYACHETERDLCKLELASLFEFGTGREDGNCSDKGTDRGQYVESGKIIEPDRSPFIALRVDIGMKASTLEELLDRLDHLRLNGRSFKVMYLKCGTVRSYDEQRALERLVGSRIKGRAEMKTPDVLFGLLASDQGWQLGICRQGSRPWLEHKHKPSNYSTGLSATLARSLVNIAVPQPAGIQMIDPCCGMGNVLIEALSMGIDIVGVEINPLAVQGARKNLNYFGYGNPGLVTLGDMNDVLEHYDAAILDMPYNLCSVLPERDKLKMLMSLRRMSSRAVIVTTEEIEAWLPICGWQVKEYASVDKGSFRRHVWLCEESNAN